MLRGRCLATTAASASRRAARTRAPRPWPRGCGRLEAAGGAGSGERWRSAAVMAAATVEAAVALAAGVGKPTSGTGLAATD